MSQVAHHTTQGVAMRFRSHRFVWLTVLLVLAAGVVALVISNVDGGGGSDTDSAPVQAQPFTSGTAHPDEGGAPIRLSPSGGPSYSARPQEGAAPIRESGLSRPYSQRPLEGSAPLNTESPGRSFSQRPQEGSAPINSEGLSRSYTQRPQEGQAPIAP